MLIDFLFELRKKKLPVSTHEWMALMEGLALGLHESSLDGFYHLCRTICVKDISDYDAFDQAFLSYFKDVKHDALALTEDLLAWLQDPKKLAPILRGSIAFTRAIDEAAAHMFALHGVLASQGIKVQGVGREAYRS